jgi:hypothetical protein
LSFVTASPMVVFAGISYLLKPLFFLASVVRDAPPSVDPFVPPFKTRHESSVPQALMRLSRCSRPDLRGAAPVRFASPNSLYRRTVPNGRVDNCVGIMARRKRMRKVRTSEPRIRS